MEKKKTYVITLSKHFPTTHKRAGEEINSKEKFLNGEKIHTIRANYPLWEKRIKEVQDGRAVLSIRQWTGKRLRFPYIDSEWTTMVSLVQNDGLSLNDWVDWFGGYDLSEPMAIIHFTKFRY